MPLRTSILFTASWTSEGQALEFKEFSYSITGECMESRKLCSLSLFDIIGLMYPLDGEYVSCRERIPMPLYSRLYTVCTLCDMIH